MGASLAGALNEAALFDQLCCGGVECRNATRDDLEFAFAALRAAMRDSVAATWGRWDDAEQRALFAPSFDLTTHRVLCDGGRDVGIVAIEPFVDRVHLARIFLVPAAQGRGIGGRVVRALLELARSSARPITLTVLRANPRAIAFYQRFGFRTVGETSTHLHLEAEPASSSLAGPPVRT